MSQPTTDKVHRYFYKIYPALRPIWLFAPFPPQTLTHSHRIGVV